MTCRLSGLIAGVDEAGRGPIAGPVVSSCVVFKGCPPFIPDVNDSKLLSEKKRIELFHWIMDKAYKVGIGIATHEEIDRLNIRNAAIISMKRAFEMVSIEPDLLLIDGKDGINMCSNEKTVIKGDRKCFFIACASIVAKVIRDRIMDYYHILYPVYYFKENKGYKTASHVEAIRRFGPCPIHRRTFSGVKEFAR